MDISFPIQLHLFLEKGTRLHKINGKLWVVLMLIASFSSFFIMPTDSLTWLHLFAILVILTVLVGLGGIYKHNKQLHIGCMFGYCYFCSHCVNCSRALIA